MLISETILESIQSLVISIYILFLIVFTKCSTFVIYIYIYIYIYNMYIYGNHFRYYIKVFL